MADKTGISWTEATWNPLVGCSRVSEGCRNCYAERMAATRLAHTPAYRDIARVNDNGEPRWTGEVRLLEDRLDQPLRWQRPRMIFVNSMSDLFHESVPFEVIAAIFGVMAAANQHVFQVLTKRPERMLEFFNWIEGLDDSPSYFPYFPCLNEASVFVEHKALRESLPSDWPLPNVWLGVSVEDQVTANERIPFLLDTPAAVRWISAEPLLGPVDLEDVRIGVGDNGSHASINALYCDVGAQDDQVFGGATLSWCVVGGESGPGARPMHPDWVRVIRDDCDGYEVPFYFKQWGAWAPSDDSEPRDNKDVVYHHPSSSSYGVWMERVGKHAAGRLLDGAVHDAWPLLHSIPEAS